MQENSLERISTVSTNVATGVISQKHFSSFVIFLCVRPEILSECRTFIPRSDFLAFFVIQTNSSFGLSIILKKFRQTPFVRMKGVQIFSLHFRRKTHEP